MAGIDEVMERLVADADFRVRFAQDPRAALAGYELTRSDLELLAQQLEVGDDAERTVEQRTSKSAMLSLLATLGELPAGDSGGGFPIVGDWDGDGASAAGQDSGIQTEMLSMDLRGGPIPAPSGDTVLPTEDLSLNFEEIDAGGDGADGPDALTQEVAPDDEALHVYGYSGAKADDVAPVTGNPPDDGAPVMGVTPDDSSPVMGTPPDDSSPVMGATPDDDAPADLVGGQHEDAAPSKESLLGIDEVLLPDEEEEIALRPNPEELSDRPAPDDELTQKVAPSEGEEDGIIIVGGHDADPTAVQLVDLAEVPTADGELAELQDDVFEIGDA